MSYKDLGEVDKKVTALNLLSRIARNTEGEGGGIRVLTADDYDYPTSNPTSIAGWLLEPDIYKVEGENVLISRVPDEDHTLAFDTGDVIIKVTEAAEVTPLTTPNYLFTQHKNNELGWFHGDIHKSAVLTLQETVDSCSNSSSVLPLSANQGKILSERIDALENLLQNH